MGDASSPGSTGLDASPPTPSAPADEAAAAKSSGTGANAGAGAGAGAGVGAGAAGAGAGAGAGTALVGGLPTPPDWGTTAEYEALLSAAKAADLSDVAATGIIYLATNRGKRDFPVFVFDPARLQRLDTTSGVVVDTQMRRALLYCLLVMDEVVGRSNYDFVYCHHAGSWFSRKRFGYIRRIYNSLTRKYKKNMQGLYVIHPTLMLKTFFTFARPFVSSKFWRKLHYVHSIDELENELGPVPLPEEVVTLDEAQAVAKGAPHAPALVQRRRQLSERRLNGPNMLFGGSLADLVTVSGDNYVLPKLLLYGVSFIERFCYLADGVYRIPASTSARDRLRACFEDPKVATDDDLYTKVVRSMSIEDNDAAGVRREDVHAVAGLIKAFFRDLADPLVPFKHYPALIAAGRANSDADSGHVARAIAPIVNQFDEKNKAVLRFLSAHLREVANSKSKHKMGLTQLCIVVAPNVVRAPPDAPPLQVASDIGVAIHVFTVLIEHADTLAGVARVPAAVVAPDDVAVGVGGDAPDVRSSRRAIPSLRSQASESGQANFSEELARAIRDNDAAVAAGSSNRSLGVGDSAAADGSAPSTVREEQGTGPDGEDQAAAAAAKAEEEAAAAAAKKAEEDAAAAAKQAEEEAAAAAAKKAEEAAAAAAKKAEEEAAAAAAKKAEEEAAAAAAKKAEEEAAAAAAAKKAEEEAAAAAAKKAEEEAAAAAAKQAEEEAAAAAAKKAEEEAAAAAAKKAEEEAAAAAAKKAEEEAAAAAAKQAEEEAAAAAAKKAEEEAAAAAAKQAEEEAAAAAAKKAEEEAAAAAAKQAEEEAAAAAAKKAEEEAAAAAAKQAEEEAAATSGGTAAATAGGDSAAAASQNTSSDANNNNNNANASNAAESGAGGKKKRKRKKKKKK